MNLYTLIIKIKNAINEFKFVGFKKLKLVFEIKSVTYLPSEIFI